PDRAVRLLVRGRCRLAVHRRRQAALQGTLTGPAIFPPLPGGRSAIKMEQAARAALPQEPTRAQSRTELRVTPSPAVVMYHVPKLRLGTRIASLVSRRSLGTKRPRRLSLLGPIFTREFLTVPRRSSHYVTRAAYLGGLWVLGITAWLATVG